MDFLRISFLPFFLCLFLLLQLPARLFALSIQQKEGSSLNRGREEDEREGEFEIFTGRIIGGSHRETSSPHVLQDDVTPWGARLSQERVERGPFSPSSSFSLNDVDIDKDGLLSEKIKILPPIPYDEEEEKNIHRNSTLASFASFFDLHRDDTGEEEEVEQSHAFLQQASQEQKKEKTKDRWLSKNREPGNVLNNNIIPSGLDQLNEEEDHSDNSGVDRYDTYYSPFPASSFSSSPSSLNSSLESFSHLSPVSRHEALERNNPSSSLSDLASRAMYDAQINNTNDGLLLSPSSSSLDDPFSSSLAGVTDLLQSSFSSSPSSLVENSSSSLSSSSQFPRSDLSEEMDGSRTGVAVGEQEGGNLSPPSSVSLSSSSLSPSSSSLSPQLIPSITTTALPANGEGLTSYTLSPSLSEATSAGLDRNRDILKNAVLPVGAPASIQAIPPTIQSSLNVSPPSPVLAAISSASLSPPFTIGSTGDVSGESPTASLSSSPSSSSLSTSSSSLSSSSAPFISPSFLPVSTVSPPQLFSGDQENSFSSSSSSINPSPVALAQGDGNGSFPVSSSQGDSQGNSMNGSVPYSPSLVPSIVLPSSSSPPLRASPPSPLPASPLSAPPIPSSSPPSSPPAPPSSPSPSLLPGAVPSQALPLSVAAPLPSPLTSQSSSSSTSQPSEGASISPASASPSPLPSPSKASTSSALPYVAPQGNGNPPSSSSTVFLPSSSVQSAESPPSALLYPVPTSSKGEATVEAPLSLTPPSLTPSIVPASVSTLGAPNTQRESTSVEGEQSERRENLLPATALASSSGKILSPSPILVGSLSTLNGSPSSSSPPSLNQQPMSESSKETLSPQPVPLPSSPTVPLVLPSLPEQPRQGYEGGASSSSTSPSPSLRDNNSLRRGDGAEGAVIVSGSGGGRGEEAKQQSSPTTSIASIASTALSPQKDPAVQRGHLEGDGVTNVVHSLASQDRRTSDVKINQKVYSSNSNSTPNPDSSKATKPEEESSAAGGGGAEGGEGEGSLPPQHRTVVAGGGDARGIPELAGEPVCFDRCECVPTVLGGAAAILICSAAVIVSSLLMSKVFSKGFFSVVFFRGGGFAILLAAILGLVTGGLTGGLIRKCWPGALYGGGGLMAFSVSLVLLGKRGAAVGALGGVCSGGTIGALISPNPLSVTLGAVVGLLLGIVLGFAPIFRDLKMNSRYIRYGLETRHSSTIIREGSNGSSGTRSDSFLSRHRPPSPYRMFSSPIKPETFRSVQSMVSESEEGEKRRADSFPLPGPHSPSL